MIVKEEGDTSAANQPYDQHLAKSDKRCIHELLDLFHVLLKLVSQSDLIVICIKALKKVSAQMWIASFKKVNLHPDHSTSFVERIKKINKKVEVGEHFFSKCNNSCFEAMPSFWHCLGIEVRHHAMSIIYR
jgi:hypothetical protein